MNRFIIYNLKIFTNHWNIQYTYFLDFSLKIFKIEKYCKSLQSVMDSKWIPMIMKISYFKTQSFIKIKKTSNTDRRLTTSAPTPQMQGWSVAGQEFMFPQTLFMTHHCWKGAEVYGTLDTEWISRVSGMQRVLRLEPKYERASFLRTKRGRGPFLREGLSLQGWRHKSVPFRRIVN